MKTKLIQFLSTIVIIIVLAGCSADKYAPVPINEETDRCVICNMAIKDDQYATQIITKEGQALKFDDLGDLNEWKKQNGTDSIGAAYVRDYNNLQWIKYEKAHFVYDENILTPMAYGVISFETKEAAEKYVEEHNMGTVLSVDQLANHTWAMNYDMMGGHDHSHGDDEKGEHTEEHGHAENNEHEEAQQQDKQGH